MSPDQSGAQEKATKSDADGRTPHDRFGERPPEIIEVAPAVFKPSFTGARSRSGAPCSTVRGSPELAVCAARVTDDAGGRGQSPAPRFLLCRPKPLADELLKPLDHRDRAHVGGEPIDLAVFIEV